jgi:large subunit ribosomal protein L7/L12
MPVFKYAKARDLYQRITAQLTADQVQEMYETVNVILGRPMRKNEFYYRAFGAQRVAGAVGSSKSAEDAAKEEEVRTVFDIRLTGYDAKSKIKIIKEVRSMVAGLGLKEAKEVVEGAPIVVQKDVQREAAEEIKARLEGLGAQIELV